MPVGGSQVVDSAVVADVKAGFVADCALGQSVAKGHTVKLGGSNYQYGGELKAQKTKDLGRDKAVLLAFGY